MAILKTTSGFYMEDPEKPIISKKTNPDVDRQRWHDFYDDGQEQAGLQGLVFRVSGFVGFRV